MKQVTNGVMNKKYYVYFSLPSETQKIAAVSIKDMDEASCLFVKNTRFLVQGDSDGPITYKELDKLLDFWADHDYKLIHGKGVDKKRISVI